MENAPNNTRGLNINMQHDTQMPVHFIAQSNVDCWLFRFVFIHFLLLLFLGQSYNKHCRLAQSVRESNQLIYMSWRQRLSLLKDNRTMRNFQHVEMVDFSSRKLYPMKCPYFCILKCSYFILYAVDFHLFKLLTHVARKLRL